MATVRQGSSFLGSHSQGCLKEASLASVTRSAGRLRFSQDPAGVSPGAAGVSPGAATASRWHDVPTRAHELGRVRLGDHLLKTGHGTSAGTSGNRYTDAAHHGPSFMISCSTVTSRISIGSM